MYTSVNTWDKTAEGRKGLCCSLQKFLLHLSREYAAVMRIRRPGPVYYSRPGKKSWGNQDLSHDFKGWVPYSEDSRVSLRSDEPQWWQGGHCIFKPEQIRRVCFHTFGVTLTGFQSSWYLNHSEHLVFPSLYRGIEVQALGFIHNSFGLQRERREKERSFAETATIWQRSL